MVPGALELSCRDTAEHLADDLFAYAVQLAPPPVPADRMVAFECLPRDPDGPELSVRADTGAGAAGLLEIVAAAGALLVAMVTVAPPGRRGHRVFGPADAEASAAMGIIETVVHAHDIARGLDVVYRPDPGVCARTLARLMPAVDPGDDPWEALLRATGRRGAIGPWR